jgi:hypothetical protein
MSRFKKIILALLFVFIAIQFIQPAHNKSEQVLPADFSNIYTAPVNIKAILQNACYDCHSNNTNYPWYSGIQPMAWMMRRHISNGKEKLNFSEFGSYPKRRQISKLKSIANQVKDNEMPLSSYKWMHKKANLSKDEKTLLMDWMQHKADSLSTNN